MDTLTTLSKIRLVFGCRGTTFHIISGYALLKARKGYRCPFCYAEVYDITKTEVGMAYFAQARPDLSPLPHRYTK
jgi:hypothetical protein